MALVMHGNGKGSGYGDGYGNGNSEDEALFVGSGCVAVCDIDVRRRCAQYCCNAPFCSKVPKMPLLLASSFSCITKCMAAFVNGDKEGWGQRGGWQQQ
jgi:hypothetical protein